MKSCAVTAFPPFILHPSSFINYPFILHPSSFILTTRREITIVPPSSSFLFKVIASHSKAVQHREERLEA